MISLIEFNGIAYFSSLHLLKALDNCKGQRQANCKVLPFPGDVFTSTTPPKDSILVFTTSNPTPLPENQKLDRRTKSRLKQ